MTALESAPAAAAILALARSRGAALAGKDWGVVAAQLADGFVYTNSRGESLDAAGYLAFLRSGVLDWDEQRIEDAAVHVFGDAAVLVCTIIDVGRWHGAAFNGRFRSTQTYVRSHAGAPWRYAAGHTSAI
jgi:hypothetical protein